MKVIVYEHGSGGGYAGQPIPPAVLSEGFGMLRSIVADFKAAGHEVTVLLDARISKLNPPLDAESVVPIFYPKEPAKFLSSIAKINDALYIIAPETGKTLQSFVELAEKTKKTSLNCESNAIEKVADKAVFYETLQKLAVTPKTVILNLDDGLAKAKQKVKKELGYPVVLKPADGISCSGLSLVNEEAQLAKAVAKISAECSSKRFIAQEFVRGEAASVSLLSTGKKAMALSLNKQNIILASSDAISSYQGGIVPFDHWLKQEAFKVAEKVAEAFSGLRGYVGIDFVLTEHKPFVVDINPRLTTSYIGLRKVAGFNVAQALVNAVLEGRLPTKTENCGVACFTKIETSKPTIEDFQKAAKLDVVVSPPFPLKDNAKSCALVIGDGKTLEDARLHLEEAKKHLLNIIT